MKRALLVGINAYPSAPLRGCINDVQAMAELLTTKCEFVPDNVRLLTDERATKKAIVERVGWLLNGARAGDALVLHLSGHGAQVAARNASGEVDNLDEVFCPVDFDWTDDTMLRDKEFGALFSAIPQGVSFTWISDSCHSGDLFRLIVRNDKLASRIKSMPVPADMAWKISVAKQKGLRPLGMVKAVPSFCGLFISGCESNQTSADAWIEEKEKFNGALTYYLVEQLDSASGMDDPMEKIISGVRKELVNHNFEQIPQLEGNKEKMQTAFLQ